jgi:flavodoxin/NAD-dependent dihydropyrimidine dehydrogenase PreA subunit
MKTLIILFSQTGNTRRVAEAIRTGILSEANACDLVELRDVDPESLIAYDLVGLGCPVFYYQEPLNVRDFIAALPQMPNRKWFVFCTHGAIMGITLQSMAETLQRKGIDVIGYHDTYAGAALPFYPYPMLTAGHPDDADLEEARIFGSLTVRHLQRLTAGKPTHSATPPSVPDEWRENAAQFTPEFLRRIFPALSINESLCTRCYACQENCPVTGIDIDHAPPRIQDPCIYCWHCVNICPQAAIEADWRRQVRLAPKLLARYRYWLNVAATQGKFRWRIDPDNIHCENPLYRQRQRSVVDRGEKKRG